MFLTKLYVIPGFTLSDPEDLLHPIQFYLRDIHLNRFYPEFFVIVILFYFEIHFF